MLDGARERWRLGVGSGCGYLLARGRGRIAQRRAGASAVAALTRLRRERCYVVLYPPRYVFANGVLSPHARASDPENHTRATSAARNVHHVFGAFKHFHILSCVYQEYALPRQDCESC